MKVWNPVTGLLQQTLEGHTEPIRSIARRPNGDGVISGGDDRTLRAWTRLDQTNKEHQSGLPEAPDLMVKAVALYQEGRRTIIATSDQLISVRNVMTGVKELTLRGHTGPIRTLAISKDGTYLVSGAEDHTAIVWHLPTGILKHRFDDHAEAVTGVAITSSGGIVVSGSGDGNIRIWSLETGLNELVIPTQQKVQVVAVTDDGTIVISASDDHVIRIWNTLSGRLEHSLRGHKSDISAIAVSSYGKRFVSAGQDREIRVWKGGRIERVLSCPDGSVAACVRPCDRFWAD